MGGCASKPKESDILETSTVTDNAVVESKNVEPEAPTQEKADEAVAEKTEESAGDGTETQKQAEPTPEAAVETVDEKASGETEPAKQEEAAATNDTNTKEEPLVTL